MHGPPPRQGEGTLQRGMRHHDEIELLLGPTSTHRSKRPLDRGRAAVSKEP
jgi:hypothetical protein